MELKVWVEGIQRIVCGVTVNTTCQDVVFALAHATGKVGRFTLIERWRNNERLLAPNENPLKLLLKWGEYANDVQFILQRSENRQQMQPQQQQQISNTNNKNNNNNNNTNSNNNNNINNNSNVMHSDSRKTHMSAITSSISTATTITTTNGVILKKPLGISNANNNNNNTELAYHTQQQPTTEKFKELKRSFGDHLDTKQIENIGIVRGIPQCANIVQQQEQQSPQKQEQLQQQPQHSPKMKNQTIAQTDKKNNSPLPMFIPKHEKSYSNPVEMTNSNSFKFYATESGISGVAGNNLALNELKNNNNIYHQLGAHNSKSINEINLAEVRNALDRRVTPFNESKDQICKNDNNSNQNNSKNGNPLDNCNGNTKPYMGSSNPYNNTPTISANGALMPPPYRDPPPPRNSPQTMQPSSFMNEDYNNEFDHSNNNNLLNKNKLNNYSNNNNNNNSKKTIDESENIFLATQTHDLLQLIKFQREKISAQQLELSKYDAEIVFLENKERDQAQELEEISREITKADEIFKQGSEQLQALQYVEEENELVKQQEKTLKSEIALLRSKLANCETELLQCKNKIRILMDDIELEQSSISNKQKHSRQNVERDFLMEMERIQRELDEAIQNTDISNKTAENLKKEIVLLENAIAEKKRQVEQLVNEMKEVNLQSLTVTTSDEIKNLLEGPNKPGGSSRRIIGSPRQLENAVPTSKNPHGVWV